MLVRTHYVVGKEVHAVLYIGILSRYEYEYNVYTQFKVYTIHAQKKIASQLLAKEILFPTLLPWLPRPTKSVVHTGMRAEEILGSTVSLPIAPGIDRQHT